MKKNRIELKVFLSAAFILSAIEQSNSMALFEAIKLKNIDLVELIIDSRVDDINMSSIVDDSLFPAIQSGCFPIIRSLVVRGANISACNARWECTPLHYAAQIGNTTVVRLLMNCGADISIRSDCGNNLLYFAVLSGKLDTVKFLLEKCRADLTALDRYWIFRESIHSQKMDIIKFLFDELYEEENDSEDLLALFLPVEFLKIAEFIIEKCGAKLDNDVYRENKS
ncbi:MAG: ankyrin repeat domain-containing protein, partial [Holosporaceae bacterium]|nr:ankyrin repeat domain-containing protein [Holosporaceae bacterium]